MYLICVKALKSHLNHDHEKLRDNNNNKRNEEDSLPKAITKLECKIQDLNNRRNSGDENAIDDIENLYQEFNELSRKMILLRETLESVGKKRSKKRILTHKSSQTRENSISEVFDAKEALLECVLLILSVSHFLDGNEDQSVALRNMLTHQCVEDSENSVNIQSLSVGAMYFEVKSQGVYDEQEIQTDASLSRVEMIPKIYSSGKLRRHRKKSNYALCNWCNCFGGSSRRKKREILEKNTETTQNSSEKRKNFVMTHAKSLNPPSTNLQITI